MGAFIRGLIYDGNKPSRTGFIGVCGFFLCLLAAFVVTIYIVINGAKFDGYDSFLTWCRDIAIGSGAVQTANKAINAIAYKKEAQNESDPA